MSTPTVQEGWNMLVSADAFEQLQGQFNKMQEDLKSSKQDSQKTQKLFLETIEANNTLIGKIGELETKFAVINRERFQLTVENHTLKKQMEEVTKTVGEMRANYVTSETEREQLRQSVADLKLENTKLNEELKSLQQSFTDSNVRFLQEKKTLGNLFKEEKENYKKQIQTSEEEKEKLRVQVQALKEQNGVVHQQITQLTEDLRKEQELASTIQTSMQSVQREKEQDEGRIARLEQDRAAILEENEDLKVLINRYTIESQQNQERIQALMTHTVQLSKEKEAWLQAKGQFEARVGNLSDLNKTNSDTIKALQTQMRQTAQTVKELTQREQDLVSQFRDFGLIDFKDPEAFIDWFFYFSDLLGLSEKEREEIIDHVKKNQPTQEDMVKLREKLQTEIKKGAWWKGMANAQLKTALTSFAMLFIIL